MWNATPKRPYAHTVLVAFLVFTTAKLHASWLHLLLFAGSVTKVSELGIGTNLLMLAGQRQGDSIAKSKSDAMKIMLQTEQRLQKTPQFFPRDFLTPLTESNDNLFA